jgi:hypothetical protein
MTLRRMGAHCSKTLDGLVTPLALFLTNMIVVDKPEDVVFERIRGIVPSLFAKHGPAKVGNNTYFNCSVEVRSNPTIGDGVNIGPNTGS